MERWTDGAGYARSEGGPFPAPTGGGRRWDDLLDEVIADGGPSGYDGGAYGYSAYPTVNGGRLLTQLAFVDDRLVDVTRRPLEGSDYEGLALDLDRRSRPPVPPEPPRPPGHELQLAWLATVVGGEQALASLTDRPLPPEDLVLEGAPARLHARLRALDERLGEPTTTLLGDEGLTAVRRFLVRLAVRSPGALLRTDRDDLVVSAVTWAVARGSDLAGPGRALPVRAVQDLFDVRSSPSQRATTYAHAVGGGSGGFTWGGYYGSQSPDVLPLGDPALLLAAFRARVLVLRDRALALRERAVPA